MLFCHAIVDRNHFIWKKRSLKNVVRGARWSHHHCKKYYTGGAKEGDCVVVRNTKWRNKKIVGEAKDETSPK